MTVNAFPDRPLTQDEVKDIVQGDNIERVGAVLGVLVSPEKGGNHIEIGFDTEGELDAFEYVLDLIIETPSTIGIAAYPKADLPPPEEVPLDTPILALISVEGGEWEWVYKGKKSETTLDEALTHLNNYRNFSFEEQFWFEFLTWLDTWES